MESHNFFWSTLIVLAVVLVIAFSMHWLDFSSTKNPETGKVEVALSIDNEKFKSDAVIAKEKVAVNALVKAKQELEALGRDTTAIDDAMVGLGRE